MRTTFAIGLTATLVAVGGCNVVLGLDPVETRATGGAGGGSSTTSGAGGGTTSGGCGTGGDSTRGAGGGIVWNEVAINGDFEAWSGSVPDGWEIDDGTIEKAPCARHGANAVRVDFPDGSFGAILHASAVPVTPGKRVAVRFSMRAGPGFSGTGSLIASDATTYTQVDRADLPALGPDWATRDDVLVIPAGTTQLKIELGGNDDADGQPASLDIDDVHIWIEQ